MNPRHVAIAIAAAAAMVALAFGLGRFGAYLVNAVAIAGIGAIFVVLLPEAIQRIGEAAGISNIVFAVRELAFGLLIITFLIFEPRGLMALLSRLKPRRANRLAARALPASGQGTITLGETRE